MSKLNWKVDGALYVLFLALILPITFAWLRYGCMPAYDFAIFTETLRAAWHFQWDPFLSTRESYWSQDHWDPITFFLGYCTNLFQSIVSPSIFLIWFEPTVIFFTALYMRQALLSRGFDLYRSWSAFIFILFAPMTWNALLFPVHPTAWALLPHVLLVVWIYDFFQGPRPFEIFKYILISVLLASCGEAFTLALAFFHLFLIAVAPRRRAALFLLLLPFGLWAYWGMYGRIVVHGSIYPHGGRIVLDPSILIEKYKVTSDFARRFFGVILACLFSLTLFFSELKQIANRALKGSDGEFRFLFLSGTLSLPLLAGRFLGDSWKFHYGVVFVGALIPIYMIAQNRVVSRRRFITLTFLCVLTSSGDWSKPFRITNAPAPSCGALNRTPTADEWKSRLEDIQQASKLIPFGSRVIAGSYLVPTLQFHRPDLEIHVLGSFKYESSEKEIEYLWVSKSPFADPWPLTEAKVDELIAQVPGQKTELKTSVLVQGPFQTDFLNHYQSSQKKIEL